MSGWQFPQWNYGYTQMPAYNYYHGQPQGQPHYAATPQAQPRPPPPPPPTEKPRYFMKMKKIELYYSEKITQKHKQ